MKNEYIFIKAKDNYCNTKEQFKNIFASNNRIAFEEDSLIVDKKLLAYALSETTIPQSKEILFHLVIESKAEKEEEQLLAIECADEVLRNTNEEYDIFLMNTIWNEASMYYAEKLYPKIVKIENTLRKIIYLFMLKNMGSKWLDTNTPDKARASIVETIDKNDLTGKVKTDWLSYADFITLGIFFSAKYSLKSDMQILINELRKVGNQSKEKIETITEDYIPKSNWERYFAQIIKDKKIWKKWTSLYNYRNKVAHSKSISKNDYDKAIKLINELKEVFDEWLNHLDNIKMTEEQSGAVENVAQKTIAAKEPIVIRDEDCSPIVTIPHEDWNRSLKWKLDKITPTAMDLVNNISKDSIVNKLLANESVLKLGDATEAMLKLQNNSDILKKLQLTTLNSPNYELYSSIGKDFVDSLFIDSSGIKATLLGSDTVKQINAEGDNIQETRLESISSDKENNKN